MENILLHPVRLGFLQLLAIWGGSKALIGIDEIRKAERLRALRKVSASGFNCNAKIWRWSRAFTQRASYGMQTLGRYTPVRTFHMPSWIMGAFLPSSQGQNIFLFVCKFNFPACRCGQIPMNDKVPHHARASLSQAPLPKRFNPKPIHRTFVWSECFKGSHPLYQIGCCFTHCVKIYVADLYNFGGLLTT